MKFVSIVTSFTAAFSGGAIAAPQSWSCFGYGTDGGVIDVNASLNQVCLHGGAPTSDCSALPDPFSNIVRYESGHDTTIPMGYSGIFAQGPKGTTYLRIYVKPFVDPENARGPFFYKALAVGAHFASARFPDLNAPLSNGEMVCVKK